MAIIYSYPTVTPAGGDLVLLSDVSATGKPTKTATVQSIADLVAGIIPGGGTVTSVSTAGTVNGLTLTGGPITGAGTATLGGTLAINDSDWSGTDLSVPNGGTGVSTLTDHGILLGSGAGAITPTAAPTNGQLLIGSTGVDPALAVLTSTGATVTITNGAGTINLETATSTLDTVLTAGDTAAKNINLNGASSKITLSVNTGSALGVTGTSDFTGVTTHSSGLTFATPLTVAETLSYYETGTWTPTLDTTAVGLTIAYTLNSGTYTRVGNIVVCEFQISLSAVSGGGGSLRMSTLPFVTAIGAESGSLVVCQSSGLNTGWVGGAVANGTNNTVDIKTFTDTTTGPDLNIISITSAVGGLTASSIIKGSITYRVV